MTWQGKESPTCQAGQHFSSDGNNRRVRSGHLKSSNFDPLAGWSGLIFKHLQYRLAKKILKKEAKISFDNIFTRNGHITATSTRQTINPYLISATSTDHSHVASHKRGSSFVNSAWQGGKSCPGGGPGEEAQYRVSV